MAAQGHHSLLIGSAGGEFTTMRAILAIRAQLNLILSVPRRIVPDHRHKGQLVACRRIKFGHMKAKGAVTQCRDDGGVGPCHARRQRERNRAADGTSHTVDKARAGANAGWRPLAHFAAVGNEDRVICTVEPRLHGAADVEWVHNTGRLCLGVNPCRRAVGHCLFDMIFVSICF